MHFTRYAIKDVTNDWVLVAMGDCMTRMGEPHPGKDSFNDPILFDTRSFARKVRDARLGNPRRFRVVPVEITIG